MLNGFPGPTTRLFLAAELLCYFVFSVWWRGPVPLWVGVGLGLVHLLGLVVLLWWWERLKAGIDLGPVAAIETGSRGGGIAVAVLLLLALVLQLSFLNYPVLSGPDEPIMIGDHADQVASLLATGWLPAIGLILASLGFWLVSLRLVAGAASRNGIATTVRRQWPWLLTLILLAAVYGTAESGSRFNWGLAERWPPLGTVLMLPLHLVTGGNDIVALRLLSMLFYLGTGYVVYRIVRLEAGQMAALVATTLALTAPALFNWGHYAFREIGGVFFFSLGILFLQRLLATRQVEYFGLIFAVAGLGYLHRRPAVLLAVVAAIAILAVFRLRLFDWRNLRALVVPGIAMIWLCLPWIAISSNVRVYVLYADHLLQAETMVSYAQALPGLVGWLLVILAITGLWPGIRRHRWMLLITATWLLLLNLLFIMDVTAPRVINRFAIHFVPGLAILAGLTLGMIPHARPVGRGLLVLVIVLAAGTLANWRWDDDRRWHLLAGDGLRHVAEPLYPFDQMLPWLREKVAGLEGRDRLVLFQPVPWQSALPLYIKEAGLYRVRMVEGHRRRFRENRLLENATEACMKAGCDYLVVPINRRDRPILHPDANMADLEKLAGDDVIRFENDYGSVWLISTSTFNSDNPGPVSE